MKLTTKEIFLFLKDYEEICKKHELQISYEDAFLVGIGESLDLEEGIHNLRHQLLLNNER